MSEPYEIYLPLAGMRWINANDRSTWMARSRETRRWRASARAEAAARRIPHLSGGRVVAELHFGDARRRDPANWAPTAKAVMDGLVDAGVFPDDNHRYVVGPDMRIGDPVLGAAVGMKVLIYPEGVS